MARKRHKKKKKKKLKKIKERIPTAPGTIFFKDKNRYSRKKKHKKGQ